METENELKKNNNTKRVRREVCRDEITETRNYQSRRNDFLKKKQSSKDS